MALCSSTPPAAPLHAASPIAMLKMPCPRGVQAALPDSLLEPAARQRYVDPCFRCDSPRLRNLHGLMRIQLDPIPFDRLTNESSNVSVGLSALHFSMN
jgi:hypothetical protein